LFLDGIGVASFRVVVTNSGAGTLQMQRFFSVILPFVLFSAPISLIGSNSNIAAQEVQQEQNSGTPSPANQAPEAGLRLPDGTPVDIEAPYTYRSIDFKPNDQISFRVVNPVKVNGVTVVAADAIATGRIDKAKRGGHWGKAGLFVWTMQTVTAVDGSQIPLRVAPQRLRGDSKGGTVATQMIITGALMPIIAPVALLAGFKRGKDAFIPAGKRYVVYVEGQPAVRMPATTRE
jgi:hypothetical protein